MDLRRPRNTPFLIDSGTQSVNLAELVLPDRQHAGAELRQGQPAEATVDLSGSNLETSESLIATRKLQEKSPRDEESIHVPKRQSVLPWVALLLAVCGGGKLWLDESRPQPVPPAPAAQDTAAADATDLARNGTPRATPAASATTPAQGHSTSAPSTPSVHASPPVVVPAPSPSPSGTTHHAPPPRVGPGNVHKLEHGHHARRSKPAPAPTR